MPSFQKRDSKGRFSGGGAVGGGAKRKKASGKAARRFQLARNAQQGSAFRQAMSKRGTPGARSAHRRVARASHRTPSKFTSRTK